MFHYIRYTQFGSHTDWPFYAYTGSRILNGEVQFHFILLKHDFEYVSHLNLHAMILGHTCIADFSLHINIHALLSYTKMYAYAPIGKIKTLLLPYLDEPRELFSVKK